MAQVVDHLFCHLLYALNAILVESLIALCCYLAELSEFSGRFSLEIPPYHILGALLCVRFSRKPLRLGSYS